MNIREISVEDVIVEDRIRTEVGETSDIEETITKDSIGQINPIAVKDTTEGFKLIAGGRRLAAHQRAGLSSIMAHIYPAALTPVDELTIELTENLARLDLRWDETCKGMSKLHSLLVQKEEFRIESGETKDLAGWSEGKTATVLGVSEGSLRQNLRLVESLEVFPELERCKTKKEAMNAEAKIIEQAILNEKAKRAKDSVGFDEGEDLSPAPEGEEAVDIDRVDELRKARKQLMLNYKLGDFFELIKEIPDKTFDFVDFDPDYGIEGVGEDFGSNSSEVLAALTMKDYQGVGQDEETYTLYIKRALNEIYRVMKDDSWLIMWFSPAPWWERIRLSIEETGIEFKALPGAWYKDVEGKASMAPDRYLGRTMEYFFYGRKGKAEIVKRGRADCFVNKVNSASVRAHPTEKPIELMQKILATFAMPGAKILVPHAGSGNTLFAAANLRMRALGIDISEPYKDRFDTRCIMWEPGSGEI